MDMFLLKVERYSDKKKIQLKNVFVNFVILWGFLVNYFHDVKCFKNFF